MAAKDQNPDSTDLDEIRRSIDAVDSRIQELINDRARYAQQVGIVKNNGKAGGTVNYYRPEREAQVLRAVAERNEGPLKDEEMVRLFREITLCLTAGRPTTLALRGTALTLGHLLLATRQLLELLEQFIDLVVCLLLLPALHRLVLVLQFVELELEQVGEVISCLLTTTPATSALLLFLLLHDVALVGLLGLLEEAEGRLLVGESRREILLVQRFLRPVHGLGGLGKNR